MRLKIETIFILFFFQFFISTNTWAEGSNEIYVNKANANTKLLFCSDFDTQCSSGGGIRTQFAIYDCGPKDRLYFEVTSAAEWVYMGYNGDENNGWGDDFRIVYRIREVGGGIVQPEMSLPAAGAGFIANIDEARIGPQQLAGAGGYDAHIFIPLDSGTYFIEFERYDNATGERAPGTFFMDLIDVTIADSVTNIIETGRLHSQGWQFSEDSGGGGWTRNSSTFYIYSIDSIITSVEFDDMEGRYWIMFCNQTGCANTGNLNEDRKSLDDQQAYVPQYPIFVNPPDPDLFPPSTVPGSIVPPMPWGETFCDSGVIVFHVNVDKSGTTSIELDFDDPYVDITLSALVTAGENLINWDGNDGAGTPVPNNVNIGFSVSYINGLTNLPLYDIEGNELGFRILLISPAGPTPLVYWDDSNILGNNGEPIGTVNFTGCLSTPPEPGCHPWTTANNDEYGDENTINTWWFTASNTTTPVTIVEKRTADSLLYDQSQPQEYCAGSFSLPFSVVIDPNTEEYHWSYTGTGATIIHANPSDNFITINFSSTATSGNIEVYGTNTNCPDPGPVSPLAITLNPIPEAVISISPNDTVCVNETVTFNGSENLGLNIVSWEWHFGDGTTDTNQNTTHVYTSTLADTVKLIVISDEGCADTATMLIWVVDPNISFTMNPDPSCEGYSVIFTGTGNATFTDWLWNFGDGNTAIGKVVSHTYPNPGTYNVSLDVCSKQVLDSIVVHPLAANDAGSDEATCEDVWFDLSTSTIPPTATDYSSILWYGGAGSFNDPTLVAPIYTPGATELGLVTLTMVAYGIAPCYNDTSQMTLNVIEGAYAQAGSDENTCVDQAFDFAGSSFVPFATNWDTLYWSGGAGYFVDPNLEVPVYVPAPGEVGPVTLTMVASGFIVNCDSVDEMILTIRPDYLMPFDTTICYLDSVFVQGQWQFASGTFYDTLLSIYDCDSVIQTNLTVRPEIDYDFTMAPDSICETESISFTQSGTSIISSFMWDFGDGQTSTQQDPTHQYSLPGIYSVTLIYTDDSGCSDEKVHTVNVFPYPEVDFTSSMLSGCINAEVLFHGYSTSNIISWQWDFGDGQTGSGQDISHIYTTYGLFDVTLSVIADNGCDSLVTHAIYIAQPPTADFEYYVVQCDTIQFTDLSSSPSGYNLVAWQWAFGDGDSSILQNPWHVYDSSGIYLVTMIVTADSAGLLCNDTITKPITVPAHPTVYFTW
ncbi:MAG: PKD domain-containing protein, partial [Bacteroidota bacterium]|nr:PKD domain-containing protein [Bacteroidota bacterium]